MQGNLCYFNKVYHTIVFSQSNSYAINSIFLLWLQQWLLKIKWWNKQQLEFKIYFLEGLPLSMTKTNSITSWKGKNHCQISLLQILLPLSYVSKSISLPTTTINASTVFTLHWHESYRQNKKKEDIKLLTRKSL